jgi:hypothetical protein
LLQILLSVFFFSVDENAPVPAEGDKPDVIVEVALRRIGRIQNSDRLVGLYCIEMESFLTTDIFLFIVPLSCFYKDNTLIPMEEDKPDVIPGHLFHYPTEANPSVDSVRWQDILLFLRGALSPREEDKADVIIERDVRVTGGIHNRLFGAAGCESSKRKLSGSGRTHFFIKGSFHVTAGNHGSLPFYVRK